MVEEYSDEDLLGMDNDVMLHEIVCNEDEDLKFIDLLLKKAYSTAN